MLIKRSIKIVVTLLIFLGSGIDVLATQDLYNPHFNIFRSQSTRSYKIGNHFTLKVDHSGYISLVPSEYHFSIEVKESVVYSQHIPQLPDLNNTTWTKEWKASDLPVFCKAEHYIQQKSGIPFRFRLGSLDYVNALEGK